MAKTGKLIKKANKGAVEIVKKNIVAIKSKPAQTQKEKIRNVEAKKMNIQRQDEDEEDDSENEVTKTSHFELPGNEDDDESAQNSDDDESDEEDSDEDDEDSEEIEKDEQQTKDSNENKTQSATKIKKDKKPSNQNQVDTANGKDRTIFVKRLNPFTSDTQLNKLFSQCGQIELCRLKENKSGKNAEIVFKDVASSMKALRFHNTIFNEKTILVDHANIQRPKSNTKCSVVVLNSEALTKLEGLKLSKIFSKCGEIADICVVCKKDILAYVTFKDENAVPKALALHDTTQDGLKIKLRPFNSVKKTKIFVQNIAKDVTEVELSDMFKVAGPIDQISIKKSKKGTTADITFEDLDGYCKAFLLHGEKLRAEPLRLLPFGTAHKRANQIIPLGKRSVSNTSQSDSPVKLKKFKKQSIVKT